MRQYPEYCFMHSAPQAYKFLEQDYPEIFERVKARIADGRLRVVLVGQVRTGSRVLRHHTSGLSDKRDDGSRSGAPPALSESSLTRVEGSPESRAGQHACRLV
jgi:type II secretory pathway predicted ATPase ExeA